MIVKEDIIKVAEPVIKNLGGFFVDIKVNAANVITLFFDREDGLELFRSLEKISVPRICKCKKSFKRGFRCRF